MRGIALAERERRAALLQDHSQQEVMSGIYQFKRAETDSTISTGYKYPGELRVLMFNMERGMRLQETIDFLKLCPRIKGFDIILGNELDDGCVRSGNKNVSKEIAEALGMNYAFGLEFIELVDPKNKKGYHGNTIFSKYPILKAGVIRLPEQYNWYFDRQRRIGGRLAVYAVLDIDGKELAACTIHLENRTDGPGRKAQMQVVVEEMERMFPGMPLLLGGDLNTNTFDGRSKEDIGEIAQDPALRDRCLSDVAKLEGLLPMCRHHGFKLLPEKPSVTRRKPLPWGGNLGLRLDWILTRDMTPFESYTVSTLTSDCTFAPAGSALAAYTGEELSDHNAVFARIRL